jgi:hypothetical protein
MLYASEEMLALLYESTSDIVGPKVVKRKLYGTPI